MKYELLFGFIKFDCHLLFVFSGTTHCVSIRTSAATALRSGDEERLELALSVQSHKLASVSTAKMSLTGVEGNSHTVDGGSVEASERLK